MEASRAVVPVEEVVEVFTRFMAAIKGRVHDPATLRQIHQDWKAVLGGFIAERNKPAAPEPGGQERPPLLTAAC
jgi:hypothetical protein